MDHCTESLLSWPGCQISLVILFKIVLSKIRIIFESPLNTILDDNIGHFPGSEPFLPTASDGLALVVQHLDRAVHEVSGLDLKVCLPLRVDNAMEIEMLGKLFTLLLTTCS